MKTDELGVRAGEPCADKRAPWRMNLTRQIRNEEHELEQHVKRVGVSGERVAARGSEEMVVAVCEATWQFLVVRGKVCSNLGGGLEGKEKVYDPVAQIRGLPHDQEKGKLNLVVGTPPEPNQVFYTSLDSCLDVKVEHGGRLGLMGREDIDKEVKAVMSIHY